MEGTLTLPRNDEKLAALGKALSSRFGDYEKDRFQIEQKWLKNLRQFKGQYDPEVKIPKDQSTAYPKYTRTKVIGTVARLMEMLFPQTERNWAVKPSPLPNLSLPDTQKVIADLQAQMVDPQTGAPQPLADEEIEKAIMEFATKRAERMGTTIEDQLSENDYVTLARQVVFSAVLYNAGVLNGPLVKKMSKRRWRPSITGAYEAYEVDSLVPYFEVMRVWDYYPDLSAKILDAQDGFYRRHVMSRNQLRKLADRPDFFGDKVIEWLGKNNSGNYRERHWETEMRAVSKDRNNVTNLSGRKYEAVEWWGFVTGHDLKAAGIDVPEDKLSEELEANVWLLGDTVIKAVQNPYDTQIRPAHVFIFEDDDTSLLGTSLPDVLRDSQLSIAEAARMLLDNSSVAAGPILEGNNELLMPGQDTSIHARKIFWREGTGAEASIPAFRPIPVDAHIPELISVIELFMSFGDMESNLPPPAIGDLSKGGSEALRTTGGASMLLGAAALPIRDTVRNFDKFTYSVIHALVDWNMEFNPDSTIKGDYEVLPRGSTSLIAKEVLAQALDYLATTLNDEERAHVNTRKLLVKRMAVRDLPLHEVLEDEQVANDKLAKQSEAISAQAAEQSELIRAQVRAELANAFKAVAQGRAADVGADAELYRTILEGIDRATGGAEQGAGGGSAEDDSQPSGGAGGPGAAPAGFEPSAADLAAVGAV